MTSMQKLLNQLRDERSNLLMPIEWDRCYQAIEMVIENTYLPMEQEISDDQAIKLLQDMNKQPMRFHCVPKEISDEEIDNAWEEFRIQNPNTVGGFQDQYESFSFAIKWYREKLKK